MFWRGIHLQTREWLCDIFYSQAAIDNLQFCCMDPDMEHHYKDLLNKWKNDEDNIKDELK